MLIKKEVNIKDERLINGLLPVLDIINRVQNTEDREIIIDFGQTTFVSPLFVLPLLVYLNGINRNVRCLNLTPYLQTVKFIQGVMPDQMRKSEFMAYMEAYSFKTFIPIINFPASKNNDDEKTAILSTIEAIIAKQLKLTSNIVTGLKYLIGEIVDNITEHSEADRAYIFAQAYPKKSYLDICIGDNGITLLGSYQKLTDNEIESDLEAIQAANRGISTKNLPNAENRGYGIITSKKMLIEGLKGQFIMMSGDAIHIKGNSLNQFLTLPQNIRWNGTVIALRIPYNNDSFSYINYIE